MLQDGRSSFSFVASARSAPLPKPASADDGRATLNRNPWVAGANTRHLAGAGIGAAYNSGGVSVNLLAAWKAGTGSPTSEPDRTPKVWLQAVQNF